MSKPLVIIGPTIEEAKHIVEGYEHFKRFHKRLKKLKTIENYSKKHCHKIYLDFLSLGGDFESDDFISFYILFKQRMIDGVWTTSELYKYFEESYIGIHPSNETALIMWLDFIPDVMDITPYIDFDKLYEESPLCSYDIDGHFRCYFNQHILLFEGYIDSL